MNNDDSVYAHDWRLCHCQACDLVKWEYQQEMGQ